MRRFLRWLLGTVDVETQDILRDVRMQLEDVRDDVEHLGRRFTKLQGQVTRAWREELPEDEDEDETDIIDEINRRAHGQR